MDNTLRSLRTLDRFLLTTHDYPDGDGLGSQVALHRALLKLGKHSVILNPGGTPEKFSIVDPEGQITVHSAAHTLPEFDAVVILDTNELKMLGSLVTPLQKQGKPFIFIDHHAPEAMPPGNHFVDERFAATGEMVFNLIQALGVELDGVMATALYVAIFTDTGGFRYRRTSALSHQIASALLSKGVEPETVHRAVFARESAAKMRLLGRTLENLELSQDGRVAWVSIPLDTRDSYGATIEDTESFIGFLTLLSGVEIAVLFREEEGNRVKVSLRGMGSRPILEIARALGGGGHRFAAGARLSGSLDSVIKKVLERCQKA